MAKKEEMTNEEKEQSKRNLRLALILAAIALSTLTYSFFYLGDMLAGANI